MGFGADGEARRPLGLCLVGGLMLSQLITLYLTPLVYTHLEKVHSSETPDDGGARARRGG